MENHLPSNPTKHPQSRCHLIGNSAATVQLIELATRVSKSTAPVLLTGPSGSEFDVVAEFIHRHSSQAASPLVRQRCVSWQDLVDPMGMVGSGTLFVEGIEHASLPVQLRLLHELEQAQLMRLRGDGSAIQTPRIIASTAVDLSQLVKNGIFLDDLFWHLSPLVIPIPPLRQRKADIADIARSLLVQIVAIHRPANQPTLTANSIQQLQAYDWPGNFRELFSTLQRAAILSTEAELTFDLSLSQSCSDDPQPATVRNNSNQSASASQPAFNFPALVQAVVQQGILEADRGHRELHQFIVDHVESALISAILKECENVQTKTATRLGINRNTLHKKMKDFGLESTD